MNWFILREQSDGFGLPEEDFQVLDSEVCSTVFQSRNFILKTQPQGLGEASTEGEIVFALRSLPGELFRIDHKLHFIPRARQRRLRSMAAAMDI